MNRLSQVVIALVLLLGPAFFLRLGTAEAFTFPPERSIVDGGTLGDLSSYISENIPYQSSLNELNLSIRFFGGQREYKRIFISGDELIPDLDPLTTDYYTRENTSAILEFANRAGVPTYCVILPTVSAIRQESLPQFGRAQIFNQKQYIEEVYSQMTGQVTVADVYPTLFNARDQYLYYRTEDNLTSWGGFYVYSVLASRLLEGISPPSLRDYDIEYVVEDYYGNLYVDSPFKDARADILSIFRYTASPREYIVEKWGGGVSKTYHTLYPLHMIALGEPMKLYLGGMEGFGATTITSTAPYSNSLLIFGDKKALPILPFLCNHYRSVTLVDLFQLDSAGYDRIRAEEYKQVLFLYGIETFMHKNDPARALRLLPEA